MSARRITLYLPAHVIAEMREEARRLDRSLAWVARRAWVIARGRARL